MTANATDKTTGAAFGDQHERVYAREYLDGIAHFNAERYYEAHEIWEAIWLRSAGDTRLFYHMLIQAAVALYHHQRGNTHGVRTLYRRASEKLEQLPAHFMSLDVKAFACQLERFIAGSLEREAEALPLNDTPRPMIRLQTSR
ncbi:MAG TPA: DUF309 domain-containing protein [Blastocatellia bacterium]|nr:DUF309 domain-containing protein [Blastocatellia bacterium]